MRTIILVVLALGLASAANNFAGGYKPAAVVVNKCSLLDSTNLYVTQRDDTIRIDFAMIYCNAGGNSYSGLWTGIAAWTADATSFSVEAKQPGSTSTLVFKGKFDFSTAGKVTFTPDASFGTDPATSADLLKQADNTTPFAGKWSIKDKSTISAAGCYPSSDVTVTASTPDNTYLTFAVTLDSSDGCKTIGLDGKTITASVPYPDSKLAATVATIWLKAASIEVQTFFTVSQDVGTFSIANVSGGLVFARSKGGISFIVIILVLLVVVVGGVLFIQKKKKDEELSRTLASNSRSHLNA